MVLMLSSGCAPTEKSTRGFVFPEGDVARGKATFVELKCTECHQVHDVMGLPKPDLPSGKVILLGAKSAPPRPTAICSPPLFIRQRT